MYFLFAIAMVGCVPLVAEDAILEHAREVNLMRAAKMPNFIAHEVVTDYVDRKGSGEWKLNYTVEDEITVKGNQISRQDLRRNGKSVHFKEWFRGGGPPTGFGAALQPVFDPHCPTTVEFAGDRELDGKIAIGYHFHSPANGCFENLYFARGATYNAARAGTVLIDGPSGNVIQFEEDALEFPERYLLVARHQAMIWDAVKIGDSPYWLPVSAEFNWTFKTAYRRRQVITYRNHRHFDSATAIDYR